MYEEVLVEIKKLSAELRKITKKTKKTRQVNIHLTEERFDRLRNLKQRLGCKTFAELLDWAIDLAEKTINNTKKIT